MNKIIFPAAIIASIVLSAFTVLNSIEWKIKDDYSIKFISKDPTGVFTAFKGNIIFDENNLTESKFDVEIDVNSINTGSGMQNKHAKSEKWFDAKNYPVIKFTSTGITKSSTGYVTNGTLNMHGVQKQISIPFTFSNNTFSGTFNVNRMDYNIGSDKGMSGKVPTDIKLEISVPVSR